ncbi:MAG: HAD-IA family hydrolase [bacterium]
MTLKLIPIDLLILDLDGTITNSIPPAVEAIQKMLGQMGLPHKTTEEINKYVGYGEIPLISGVIGTKDPELLGKAMRTYEDIYMKEGFKKIALYPHVKEFLEYFRDKTKVILSNKKDAFIKKILDDHNLTGYFAEVHGGDTLPCLKPDPHAINEMMKRYKVGNNRVLLVGDMTVDIETGKNAKVHTCAVTYGFDDKNKLKGLEPDLLIDDLLELRGLIK